MTQLSNNQPHRAMRQSNLAQKILNSTPPPTQARPVRINSLSRNSKATIGALLRTVSIRVGRASLVVLVTLLMASSLTSCDKETDRQAAPSAGQKQAAGTETSGFSITLDTAWGADTIVYF